MIGKGIVFRDSASRMAVITGVVMELGSPVIRQVRAYSRTNGALLESTYSNKDGKYKLYLPYDSSYTLVAVDSRKTFNAVIQDNVVPK
ncbi:hypothetical protein [Acinetobacter towneri]|uniref:hypothetical protein n=1 Tax=Acinetobacter towneri TaxID=202956 RepID=UPI0020972246|nr:hypothetical protein [Acinetobacter towneri]MCO8059125.1 hypothetical protein [Acinetobacter towneri]MCO8064935.1 hypothetical protein [Acinetobacter towneri]